MEHPTQHSVCGSGGPRFYCLAAGEDVTDVLLADSVPPVVAPGGSARKKRQTSTNNVINAQEPIKLDEGWSPPVRTRLTCHFLLRIVGEIIFYRCAALCFQSFQSVENDVSKNFCEDYLYKNYSIGKLCMTFPNVNVQQELQSCMEDIQVSLGYATRKSNCNQKTRSSCFFPLQCVAEKFSSRTSFSILQLSARKCSGTIFTFCGRDRGFQGVEPCTFGIHPTATLVL